MTWLYFFITIFYTFSFFPFSFALQIKFLQKRKQGFPFQRAYVDSLVTLRDTLLVVLKFCIRTCHHRAVRSLWWPHTARGDLTSSCPAWRPAYVCFHLPVQSCFFASELGNKQAWGALSEKQMTYASLVTSWMAFTALRLCGPLLVATLGTVDPQR